jgi:transposase, IS30 family
MLTIHQRPFPPEDRSQPGQWEGDLIIGKDQRSAIGSLVERRTRMVRLLHLLQRDGEALHDALKARMADLPAALLRSITSDQGAEMARHALSCPRSCEIGVQRSVFPLVRHYLKPFT